jgi:hypothetical protein
MNFEEWFLSEFGRYGFSLSPTMYDPFTFMPCKAVMVADGCGLRKTSIKITPELSDDLRGWGVPYDHHVEGLRELIRMEIRRQYGHLIDRDFKPNKIIPKLNFI